MLVLIYVFMRFVPTYSITSTVGLTSMSAEEEMEPAPSSGSNFAAPLELLDGQSNTLVLSSASDILATLLFVSALVLLGLAVVGSVIGWIVAGRVLRPLGAINEAAQIASTGSLDHRIGLSGPQDELRDLSDTFDDMLGKLEKAFGAHRRFAANASHELRTPLATIQTLLDVALTDPDVDVAELRRVADRVYATNRHNMHTVEALLDLAEVGHHSIRVSDVDLGEICARAVSAVEEELLQRNIQLTTQYSPSVARGDRILLCQVVSNLVDNAVMHNVEGGFLIVRCGYTTSGVPEVFVSNSGLHVSSGLIETMREPFVRGAGRAAPSAILGRPRGRGLGLAISEMIVSAHGGDLDFRALPQGGLSVALTIPTNESAALDVLEDRLRFSDTLKQA